MKIEQLGEYKQAILEMDERMERAQARYANFASSHEALGVALEEWNELQDAVKANAIEGIREEALDLAAVLIRLAIQCRTSDNLRRRSVK